MELSEKVQLVGISVLISLLVGGGSVVVYNKLQPTIASGNDGPIIMAGGSLYVATPASFGFSADITNPQTVFSPLTRNVFEVDVSDLATTGIDHTTAIPVGTTAGGSVEMDYCNKSAGCGTAGEGDKVVITWDNTAGSIKLTTGQNEQLPMITPNLRVHSHKGWVPTQVIVTVGGVQQLSEPCSNFNDLNDAGVSAAVYECTAIVHTCATSITCKNTDAVH